MSESAKGSSFGASEGSGSHSLRVLPLLCRLTSRRRGRKWKGRVAWSTSSRADPHSLQLGAGHLGCNRHRHPLLPSLRLNNSIHRCGRNARSVNFS